MARLTADMTRLAGEIHAAHAERQQVIQGLRQAAAELKHSVGRMQIEFRTARAEMTRRQRRNLHEFMQGLEGRVGALRDALRTDLAGARAAWTGHARSEHHPEKAAQRRRRP